MDEYQERVIVEFEELDAKIERLHVFIESSRLFPMLNKVDQRLLVDQRHAMTVYRNILRDRIALFPA